MTGYINELKGIWKNKKLFIALLGIAIMPLLYGGLLISFFWDPYDAIEELPVAVVNEDIGAQIEDEHIHAGDDFIKELKKDPAFDFDFVSKETAEAGLENFDYYFYVEIPKHFSEHILSIQNNKPDTPSIYYEVNEDYNFVSSQIAQTAISTMEEELSRSLTLAYIKIANDAFSQLGEAVITLHQGSQDVMEGTDKAHNNMTDLKEALEQLSAGSLELSDGLEEVTSVVGGIQQEATLFYESIDNSEAFQNIKPQIEHYQQKNDDLINQLENNALSKQTEELEQIDEFLTALTEMMNASTTEFNQVSNRLEQIITPLEKLEERLTSSTNSYVDVIKELEWAIQELQQEDATAKQIETLKADLTQLNRELLAIQNELDQFETIMDNHDPNWHENESLVEWYEHIDNHLSQSIESNETTISEIQQVITQIEAQSNTQTDLLDHILAILKENEDEWLSNQSSIENTVEETIAVLNQLQDSVETLQAYFQDASFDDLSMDEVVTQLTQIESQILSQLYELDSTFSGINQTYDDIQTLTDEAFTGLSQLNDGLSELNQGGALLAENLSKASDGSQALADGLHSLFEGAHSLSKNMESLKEKVLGVDPNDQQQEMASHPVQSTSKHEEQNHSYGEGLSPYFLSIGLFVGGLTLSIIYPFRTPLGPHKNWVEWFTGKIGVVWTISFIQSTLVSLYLLFVIGLDAVHPLSFYFFTLFAGLVFVTLVFMLVSILDNPGRFVAIILLIIQLGGSGGSFPVELLASPLQSVHGWLPMTYSVLGFRSFLFMESPALAGRSILFLLAVLVISIVLLVVFYKFTFQKYGQYAETKNS